MRRLAPFLLCAVLFGPERIPLDDFTHWEIRVRLCTQSNEPHVIVDTRTYEIVRGPGGTVERKMLSEGPEGWVTAKDTRLYVTPEAPKP